MKILVAINRLTKQDKLKPFLQFLIKRLIQHPEDSHTLCGKHCIDTDISEELAASIFGVVEEAFF
jgi:hypothetical protein